MLELGFRHSHVAALSDITHPRRLRHQPLDAGPRRILRFKGPCFLVLPSLLEHRMLLARTQ